MRLIQQQCDSRQQCDKDILNDMDILNMEFNILLKPIVIIN